MYSHRGEALIAHNILRVGDWKLIAGTGDDGQDWFSGMLRDCMLGTDGGVLPPPVAADKMTSLCPNSVYNTKGAGPTPGLLDCSTVDAWGGTAADKWLCSQPCTQASPCLFNLTSDVGETTDVAALHPEVVASMKARLAQHRDGYWNSTQPYDPGTYCNVMKNRLGGWIGPWL